MCVCVCVCVCVHVRAQLYLTLCDTMDCSLPDTSLHGIFQARILERIAAAFSRGSSQPRDQTCLSYVSCTGRQILYQCATSEAHDKMSTKLKKTDLLTLNYPSLQLIISRILVFLTLSIEINLGIKDCALFFVIYKQNLWIKTKFFKCKNTLKGSI